MKPVLILLLSFLLLYLFHLYMHYLILSSQQPHEDITNKACFIADCNQIVIAPDCEEKLWCGCYIGLECFLAFEFNCEWR